MRLCKMGAKFNQMFRKAIKQNVALFCFMTNISQVLFWNLPQRVSVLSLLLSQNIHTVPELVISMGKMTFLARQLLFVFLRRLAVIAQCIFLRLHKQSLELYCSVQFSPLRNRSSVVSLTTEFFHALLVVATCIYCL